MNRYLIGFSSDITKIRNQLFQNFDLLITEEGKKDIQNRIENLPEEFESVFFVLAIGGAISMISSSWREEVVDLYENIRANYERNPYGIHFTLIYIPEYILLLCHPNEKHHKRLLELGNEIRKNELIGVDEPSLSEFKIETPIGQDNRNFPLYFAYTLRQIPVIKMAEFLDYQLTLFKGNFKSFLESILIEYDEENFFLGKTKRVVNRWLEQNQYSTALASKVGDHKSDDLKMKIALEELEWMLVTDSEGNPVIFKAEFKRLMKYTEGLILKNCLPLRVKPICALNAIGFSKRVRLSFYKIHKQLQGTNKINDKYIEFLHTVFSDHFKGEMSTTKAKFSSK